MKVLSRPFKNGAVRLRYLHLGKDLQVSISGGREHIGAVALAVYGDSVPDNRRAMKIALPGHREDELAQAAALRLSRALRCTVSVSAGIHFDNLTKTEIGVIVKIVDEMIAELIGVLD